MAKVLVVEDDADLRYLHVTTLALAGYATQSAADGLSALQRIDENRPDLIVLD